MTLEQAVAFLGITLPTTPNAIKRAFHRRSLEEHPDHSKHPEAAERFRRLKEAHELVKATKEVLDEDYDSCCQDGTPFSELGLGLGPTTNGVACDRCGGRGYTVVEYTRHARCTHCRIRPMTKYQRSPFWWGGGLGIPLGDAQYDYVCGRCGGAKTINGKTCPRCNGTGWYQDPKFGNHCVRCRGTELVNLPKPQKVYHRCVHCEGTGEIEIWNPVLRKGLLS